MRATSLLRAMRWALATLAAAPLLALAPHAASAQRAGASSITIRAENRLPIERHDEIIALAWGTLRLQLPALAPGRVRVRDAAAGTELATQLLDADADGRPDSLLVLASFRPGEVRVFHMEAAPAAAAPPPRVNVKFVPERTDVAWESDRIAYRTYGQLLWQLEDLHTSGIDVWMKRTRDLIVDRWYEKGHDEFHTDRGEGADFFRVGRTLGAGGTAIWRGGALHRAENFASHRIIAGGPLRVIFELVFDPWDAGGMRVTETKRITMDAGTNLFRQESVFRAEGSDSLTYAVGFAKRRGLVGSTSRAGAWAWVSGWGPVDRTTGGHGDLGTAALLDGRRFIDVKETDDHFVALASARSGEPVVHYTGAGWSASGDFPTPQSWWSHLDALGQRLSSPIAVTIGGGAPGAPR